MKSKFFDPATCPFEVLGYFEDLDDAETGKPLGSRPVTLEQIKADKRLKGMTLVRISRLSVQPVTDEEWKIISKLGGLD